MRKSRSALSCSFILKISKDSDLEEIVAEILTRALAQETESPSYDCRMLISLPATFQNVMSANKRAGRMISEMIAYCGLDCSVCKAFKATQTRDIEWKRQIAKHWSDQGEIKFKPEDVDCHGCKSDVISGFCRKICEIKPCAEERKVETCAHCKDYPCGKLKEFLSNEDPIATKNLEEIHKALQA